MCQAPKAAVEALPPKESNGVQRNGDAMLEGQDRRGQWHPWTIGWIQVKHKHRPTGSSFLWLKTSDLSRRFYLQCSCRKQVHLSPSPSTSSWNGKIGHNPSTEHRAPLAMSLIAFQSPNEVGVLSKLNFVTRLISNSVTTSWAQDIQDNQGTRRAQRKAMVRKRVRWNLCRTLGGVRQASRGRGGGKLCKYNVQCDHCLLANERQTTIGMKAFWALHPIPGAGFGLILQWGSVKFKNISRLQHVEGELTLPKLCSYASGKMARFFSVAASLTHQA